MHHHPRLGKGEGDEHPDGEERDERVRVAAKDQDQDGRQSSEHQHPVGEDQAVAQVGKLMRQVAVARQHRGHPWETGKACVGRHRQHQEGRSLDEEVDGIAVQQAARQCRQDRFFGLGQDAEVLGQANRAEEQSPHQDRHDP